jgi:hypothetical protein
MFGRWEEATGKYWRYYRIGLDGACNLSDILGLHIEAMHTMNLLLIEMACQMGFA